MKNQPNKATLKDGHAQATKWLIDNGTHPMAAPILADRLVEYSDQQNAELKEQLASEIESREHWQRQTQRYQKYHKELNAALERVKELEAENARYRDRIGEALKFLQSRQQTTPGLGAPVTILKQALEK